MAGIKLKSGADFCNFQATRMCLHNDLADPASDFGIGRIYFNTSTSVGSGKRVRIYDGSNFRSLAYFDEIANNEAFNALVGRVDEAEGDIDSLEGRATSLEGRATTTEGNLSTLKARVDAFLDGGVDSDAVLENLAEIQKFLDNYSSATDLSEILDKKLDKAGGTITSASTPLIINRTNNQNPIILYQVDDKAVGVLGFNVDGDLVVSPNRATNSNYYNVLHAGNVGEYKAGNSDKLEGQTLYWVQNNGLKFRRVKVATASNIVDANADLAGGGMIYSYSGFGENLITNSPSDMQYGHIWQIGSHGNDVLDAQLAWDINHGSTEDVTRKLWWRARDSTNGWTYAKWHQIAFTDSNVASATKLEDDTAFTIWGNTFFQSGKPKSVSGHILLSNATYIRSYLADKESIASLFGVSASNTLLIGYGLQTLGDIGIYGKTIYFAPNGESVRVRISESGAVYINSAVASDDTEKLIVGGIMRISSAIVRQMATLKRTVMSGSSDSLIFGDDKGLTFFRGSEIAFQTQTGGGRNMTMTWNDGDPRVGIGTSTPTEKLHVVGNLLVEGNIIATGEVSAGGAGEESGEGGTTGGGGDALIYSQEFTPSTTSVSIAHNLSSTKGVIVQVWEKDTIAGTWNMVLVDIEEVDSNNIKLNFGRTETTLHKVVIMG